MILSYQGNFTPGDVYLPTRISLSFPRKASTKPLYCFHNFLWEKENLTHQYLCIAYISISRFWSVEISLHNSAANVWFCGASSLARADFAQWTTSKHSVGYPQLPHSHDRTSSCLTPAKYTSLFLMFTLSPDILHHIINLPSNFSMSSSSLWRKVIGHPQIPNVSALFSRIWVIVKPWYSL